MTTIRTIAACAACAMVASATTATAASTLITSKQIRNRTIQAVDLKPSLLKRATATKPGATGPRGPAGPAGQQGQPGPPGATPTIRIYTKRGASTSFTSRVDCDAGDTLLSGSDDTGQGGHAIGSPPFGWGGVSNTLSDARITIVCLDR